MNRDAQKLLGRKVHDRVTGFEGIVTGYSEYLNGCVRALVQGPVKDGKVDDGFWLDIEQCEVVGDGIIAKLRRTGGPRPDAERRADPTR